MQLAEMFSPFDRQTFLREEAAGSRSNRGLVLHASTTSVHLCRLSAAHLIKLLLSYRKIPSAGDLAGQGANQANLGHKAG